MDQRQVSWRDRRKTRTSTEVFKVLFSSEGSGIYIRPMGDYIRLGSTVDGYRLVKYPDDRHSFEQHDPLAVLAES